ncbi:hypothetical protein HDU87_001125 [Geranomyces variabilis]|uniref:GAIN-B domain-containing protein n=1 Tax=Geranomyces variabilis TaxID=109894 RepID=A0AAD5XP49_9FUNG|nr:hypothetical protein HDU87_001125 [Geranomyces variabilis]
MKIHFIFRAALAALLVVQSSTTTTDDSVTITDDATSPSDISTSATTTSTTTSSASTTTTTNVSATTTSSTSTATTTSAGTTTTTSTNSATTTSAPSTPATSTTSTTSTPLASTSSTQSTTPTPSQGTSTTGSTATLTPGGLYYPVYPYYKVMVDGQQYNVTWVSAQSATGRGLMKPYAYPIVSSSSATDNGAPYGIRPIDYPQGTYPCNWTVSGVSYTGACSLGGRNAQDQSECYWNNGNGNNGNNGNMNGGNGTGMGNNTANGQNGNGMTMPNGGNSNQNGNGMTTPCTIGLPGFNGTNTQIQNAIQVSTSCFTTTITGPYGEPINSTYFSSLAFYDTTGNFTGMQDTNMTCYGSYTNEAPAIVSSWQFPCKPIGNNITAPTQNCQVSDVPEVQEGPLFTVTKASCSQDVMLYMGGTTSYTATINATCTTYFDPGSGYKVTYYRGPCYSTFPTQVLQPDSSYAWVTLTVGTTCIYQDNQPPTNSTGPAPCTQPINALVNGTYNGTSLQPASCTSYQTSTSTYETYQYTCYQWQAASGYSPTSCYGTVKQYPGLVSTRSAPCQISLYQYYVGGVLYQSPQSVNTTCVSYTQFNGQYNYTQTSYMFPCQMGITFNNTGNASAVSSYIDATCESQYSPMQPMNGNMNNGGNMNYNNCYGNNCNGNNWVYGGSVMNSLWTIRSYMDTKNVPNYFNGSRVMPATVNTNVTVLSYGNETLTLWSYPCIGSLSSDPNGYIAPGTFSVNSTTCVAYQSQLNTSTLYIYPCDTTRFCFSDMPLPGLTECQGSGCSTYPGMTQVPYPCANANNTICYTSIGWDLCNGGGNGSHFLYPSQFSAFNSWIHQLLQEPARDMTNGTFYYPSELFHLDATQSLTPFNLPQSSGHLDFSQGPSDTWSGPFWSNPSTNTGATPIYTFPGPAIPDTDNSTSPWNNFPYLPGPPVPAAPNALLTEDFSKGNWPMPVWPMIPVSQTGDFTNNSLPWIVFPAIPDNTTAPPPPVVNPCPSPPSNGTLLFTGSGLVNFNTNTFNVAGSGQATLSLPLYNCTYASLQIFWSIDSNIMPNPKNASATQTGETLSTSFNYALQLGIIPTGAHNVTARSVFLDANGMVLASPIATGNFSINAPVFTATLNVQNATVNSARNLTLDASTSFDSIDPCYFKRFVSSIVYKGCQSTNAGITPYTGRVLVYFTCQTIGGAACPFPIQSTATIPQMFNQTVSTSNTFVAVQAYNDTGNTTLFIVTDVPTYTLQPSVLRDGDYIFNAQIQHLGFAKSASGAAAEIVVQTTQYFIAQSPLTLTPFNPSAVYIAPAPVTVVPAVSASDAVSLLTFAWSLRSSSNNVMQTSAIKDNWIIDTSALTDDIYSASLITTDTHGNSAKSVVSFSVRTTIATPNGCTVTPTSGQELSTQFTVQCPSADTLIPGALYFYSYVLNGLTSTIAYPGSASQVMTLPAGPASSGNIVPISVRAYIPNNLVPSAPLILNVTVTPVLFTNTAALQTTYASKFTSTDASSIGASMTSFTAQIATLDPTSQGTKDAVAAVASAISTSALTVTDPNIAISMAGAFASLLSVGSLTTATKNQASSALVNIASVLATPGNYPPLSALTSVASAVLSSSVSNDTTSGTQTLQAFNFVGQALANSISAGQNTSLSIPGSDLNVFAATINTIPAGLGTTSLLQRRTTSGNCAASFGPAIAASVASLSSSAVVTIQANCLTSSPYPFDAGTLNTDSQTLTPSVLTIGVQANGGSWPNALTQNITVTIPTAYNTNTFLRRRSALERRATTYSAQCVVWDSTASQWTPVGCTATSSATGGTSTTCNCNTLGTFSVRVQSRLVAATTTTAATSTISPSASPTVSATPTPTGSPGSGISKGAIAGAVIGSVAGAALIGGLAYYFLKVRG